ncbi:MAG: tyrosine-type recombinase/integrase [Nitrospirota bacterium]
MKKQGRGIPSPFQVILCRIGQFIQNFCASLSRKTTTGTQYNGMNVLHAFQKACVDAGLPKMRFHDLRHTTGSRLARLGCDIHFIAAVLNHSQLSTTRRYSKHNVASLQKGLDLLAQK